MDEDFFLTSLEQSKIKSEIVSNTLMLGFI